MCVRIARQSVKPILTTSFTPNSPWTGLATTAAGIIPFYSRLYTVDGRCYIEDLNSSNGVFVNGRRIHEVFQIQRCRMFHQPDRILQPYDIHPMLRKPLHLYQYIRQLRIRQSGYMHLHHRILMRKHGVL